VLHRHVLRLNAETRASVEAAKIHLMFHGGRPDLPLASWFRSAAQREAQHALAAACGRTLLVDRIEAQWDGPGAGMHGESRNLGPQRADRVEHGGGGAV
jgi:hypothetical protein